MRKLKKLDFSFIYVFSMINLILKDFFFQSINWLWFMLFFIHNILLYVRK